MVRRLHCYRFMTIERLNAITGGIIQCAIEVHRVLGPGLMEKIYLVCLCYELRARGLTVVTDRVLPIHYKDITFDIGYRIDVLVEDEIILELKAIETVL